MTETPDAPASKTLPVPRSPEQTAKAARLATALRDNLKRRKAAVRAAPKPGN